MLKGRFAFARAQRAARYPLENAAEARLPHAILLTRCVAWCLGCLVGCSSYYVSEGGGSARRPHRRLIVGRGSHDLFQRCDLDLLVDGVAERRCIAGTLGRHERTWRMSQIKVVARAGNFAQRIGARD